MIDDDPLSEDEALNLPGQARAGAPERKQRSHLLRWLKMLTRLVLCLLLAWFWWQYASRCAADLRETGLRVLTARVGLSFVLYLAACVLFGTMWGFVLVRFHAQRIHPVDALRCSSLAWFGRYLPGKIWSAVGKIHLSARRRDDYPQVAAAVFAETAVFELAGILVALGLQSLSNVEGAILLKPAASWLAVGGIAGVVVVAHPRVFKPISAALLRLVKRPPLSAPPPWHTLPVLLLSHMGVFVLFGCAFFLPLAKEGYIGAQHLPWVIAAFSASWVIGFLALLAPGGIGVREAVLVAALMPLGAPEAAILAAVVLSRILVTAAEVVCMLASVLAYHLLRASTPEEPNETK